jgi:hypothetical protein
MFEHDLRADAQRLSQGKPESTFPDHALDLAADVFLHPVGHLDQPPPGLFEE